MAESFSFAVKSFSDKLLSEGKKMMTFTLIFFAMIVIVGAVAVTGFAIYMKRKTKKLRMENHSRMDESSHHDLSD